MRKFTSLVVGGVATLGLTLGVMTPAANAGIAVGSNPSDSHFTSVKGVTQTVGGALVPRHITGLQHNGPVPPQGHKINLTVTSCTGFNVQGTILPSKSVEVVSSGSWGTTADPSVSVMTARAGGYVVFPHHNYNWSLTQTDPSGNVVHRSEGVYDFETLDGYQGAFYATNPLDPNAGYHTRVPCPTTPAQLCNPYGGTSAVDCDPALFGIGGGNTDPDPVDPGDDTNDPVDPTPQVKPKLPKNFIKKWSKKAGKVKKAKFNKKVRVNNTVLTKRGKQADAKVKYVWKLNKKTVGKKKNVKVKRGWRGKKLVLKIKVTAPGYKPLTKTVGYGKARR